MPALWRWKREKIAAERARKYEDAELDKEIERLLDEGKSSEK